LNAGVVIPCSNDGQSLRENLDAINRLDGVIVADALEESDRGRMAVSFTFDPVFLRTTATSDIIVERKRTAVAKRTGFAFDSSIPKISILR